MWGKSSPDIAEPVIGRRFAPTRSLIRPTRYSMFAYFLHCTNNLHRLRELSAGRAPKRKPASET